MTAFWALIGLVTQVRCPLTVLEKHLLALDGTEPYPGTFIGHHVAGVLFPSAWQNAAWYAAAVLVLAGYTAAVAHHLADSRLAPR